MKHIPSEHLPAEIHQKFLKDSFQEIEVASAVHLSLGFEHPKDGPGVHRRIDVPEIPFIGRKLSIGVHIPFTSQQV